MEEEKRGGESICRVSSSFFKSGDRQMFTMELRPGETTIVSWKKLMKDANKVNGSSSTTVLELPVNAHPRLESRIAPVAAQPDGEEVKDETAPSRFSAVIEKIERLYMGKDSSDEEDHNDIPDDDQYDTEDSFIDDAELDEYFEVDNSAIKHGGFFVNRGQLERIESTALPSQQPKKRRRKDLAKGNGENDDGCLQNKHAKPGKMASGKNTSALAKTLSTTTQAVAVSGEDIQFQSQLNSTVVCPKKKSSDSKTIIDPSVLKVSNGDATMILAEVKDIEKQKTGSLLSKDPSSKFKEMAVSSDSSHSKHHDKNVYVQSKSQSGRPSSGADELDSSIRVREKNGNRELSDVNTFEGKYSAPTTKTPHMHKKDGSNARPKGSILEKAIRELEKMVAESRPPNVENQEADNSSQAIKRRLPREIKMKLAKVARLAQASHGKVSKELLNRLMSILGHLIQLRTLKRNLKVMISMGLSAKQETNDRFQRVKKEVIEMLKVRAPSMESKALEKQAGASDDFQEIPTEQKEVSKRKYSMDAALEDKICDLYDLYVDGLDDDAGPQVRRLYAELAELWPNGFMDNHGIKRAICRAKERRRELYGRKKDQEKMKRKKMLASKTEEGVRVEGGSILQPQYTRESSATLSGGHCSANKSVPASTVVMQPPSPINVQSFDKVKQEKFKGTSSHSPEDARVGDSIVVTKKKVRRKPEVELDETHLRSEERQKSLKQSATPPLKPNLQSTALSSLEQSS
ncbi:hypothetical protein CsatB_008495 [Cannabis sativa]|uniref:Hpc2-related domain-containing protein n=1 Tax=Cannabis sativa TaxID=3483 RepID=A0A803NMF7_CANSA|nr:ubinuclein-1 isoform X1 [Cannabis sativa]